MTGGYTMEYADGNGGNGGTSKGLTGGSFLTIQQTGTAVGGVGGSDTGSITLSTSLTPATQRRRPGGLHAEVDEDRLESPDARLKPVFGHSTARTFSWRYGGTDMLRPVFDAPQAVDLTVGTPRVPTLSARPCAEAATRQGRAQRGTAQPLTAGARRGPLR